MGTGVTDCDLGEGYGPKVPARVPEPFLPCTWLHRNPCVRIPTGETTSEEQQSRFLGMSVTSWGAVVCSERYQ